MGAQEARYQVSVSEPWAICKRRELPNKAEEVVMQKFLPGRDILRLDFAFSQ
jgi:hypothetical protein